MPDLFEPYSVEPVSLFEPYKPEQSWLDWGISTGIRTAPGLAGSLIGGIAGTAIGGAAGGVGAIPGMWAGSSLGGSIGSGIGESLGQWYDGEEQNLQAIGTEAAIGLIPNVSKIPVAGAGLRAIGKYALGSALEGGVQGFAGSAPRKVAREGNLFEPDKWELPTLEEATKQGVASAAFGGVLGGGLGAGKVAVGNYLNQPSGSQGSPYGTRPSDMYGAGFGPAPGGAGYGSQYASGVYGNQAPGYGPTRVTDTGIGYRSAPLGNMDGDLVNPPSQALVPTGPVQPMQGSARPVEPQPPVVTIRNPDASVIEYYRNQGYVSVPNMRSPEGYPQMVLKDYAGMYTGGSPNAPDAQSSVPPTTTPRPPVNARPGTFQEGFEPAGDTVEIPNTNITPEVISNLREGGYELASRTPATSIFRRLVDDDTGTADFTAIYQNLRRMLGRDPSAAEIEQAMDREVKPGQRTGLVAPFRGEPGSPEANSLNKWYDAQDRLDQSLFPQGARPPRIDPNAVDENSPWEDVPTSIPVRIPGRDGAAEWPPNSGNVVSPVNQPFDVMSEPGLPMGPLSQPPVGPGNRQLAQEAIQRYRLNSVANARVPQQQDLFAQTGEILDPEITPDMMKYNPTKDVVRYDPSDLYEQQKADLIARDRAGQVVDYEDELAALDEAFDVKSTMSVEMDKYVNEVQRANQEGYKVYPPGNKIDGPVVRTFESEGKTYTVVGYDNLVSPENPTGRYITDGDDITTPQAMRVPKVIGPSGQENVALGGADARVWDVAATSLYAGERPIIVAKELMQNVFDEHRSAGVTRPAKVAVNNGDINPYTGESARSVTVKDYGRGMNAEQIYTNLTNLGATGKGNDPTASGGFGFAKAAPFGAGKYAEVKSVVVEGNRKYEYQFEGTFAQLKNQVKGVELNRKQVPDSTPTGLQVKVYFTQDDYAVGRIPDYVRQMVKNSPGVTSPVATFNSYAKSEIEKFLDADDLTKKIGYDPIEIQAPETMPKLQGTISTPGADIEIHYNDPSGSEINQYQFSVLNKGLFQSTRGKGYGRNALKNVPESITANIIATVEEGTEGYPFTANREQLDSKVENAIDKWVNDNIVSGAHRSRVAALQKAYDNIRPIPASRSTVAFYDEGSRFTPDEVEIFRTSPSYRKVANTLEIINKQLLATADSLNWSGGWGLGPNFKPSHRLAKFGILHKGVGTKGNTLYGIHIPKMDDPKSSAILIDLFQHIILSESSPNPVKMAASKLFATMTHEIAHIPGGGHDEDFAYRDADLRSAIDIDQEYVMKQIIASSLGDLDSGQIHPELQGLLDIFKESRSRGGQPDALLETGVNSERPGNSVRGKEENAPRLNQGRFGFEPYQQPDRQLSLGLEPFGGQRKPIPGEIRHNRTIEDADVVAHLMEEARTKELNGELESSRELRKQAAYMREPTLHGRKTRITRGDELMALSRLRESKGDKAGAARLKEKADKLYLDEAGQLTLSFLKGRALKVDPQVAKNANYFLNPDDLENHISHYYAKDVLREIEIGEPGLSVVRSPTYNEDWYKSVTITYRNPDGYPIAFAHVVDNGVVTLAADKEAGLLYGRALKAVGQEIVKLGAARASGTYSVHTQKLIKRLVDFINDDSGAINLSALGAAWDNLKRVAGWGQGRNGKAYTQAQTSWITEMLMLPAAATTTMDLSAPGRQGLAMINTPQFWKAAGAMFKGLTPSGFAQIDADLKAKPLFQRQVNRRTGKVSPSFAEQVGLKLFVPASQPGPHAQALASRWIETGGNIPYFSKAYENTVGVPVRASNRAFITFLNHLNANRFEFLMNRAQDMSLEAMQTGRARTGVMPWKQGFTQQEAMDLDPYRNLEMAKEIAEFVNTATGHGPLKTHLWPSRKGEKSLEIAADKLGKVLFSPGLLASRVRMLNPNTYIMATPFVRKQYLKAMLGAILGYSAIATMISMAAGDDAEIGTTPTSSDFGKIRIGDTRIDPSGGFLPYLVLGSRLYSGGYTSSATGQYRGFGEGFQATTQWTNIERFGANKLNPSVKFAYDLASASEYKPFHVKDRVMQLFIPLVIQDFYELGKDSPELLPIGMLPITFGAGTQTYSKGESVGKFFEPEDDWLVTGGGFSDLTPQQ